MEATGEGDVKAVRDAVSLRHHRPASQSAGTLSLYLIFFAKLVLWALLNVPAALRGRGLCWLAVSTAVSLRRPA